VNMIFVNLCEGKASRLRRFWVQYLAHSMQDVLDAVKEAT